MDLKSYLIGPFEEGLRNDLKPWILPENAFQTLTNAYIWRGRVKKRFGTSYLGDTIFDARLRINLGTTDGAGAFAGNAPGSIFKVGQSFSIGSDVLTVNALGNPAALLSTTSATGTYDTTTGALTIAGAPATTAVFFYPSEPVMGLRLRESAEVNFEDIIAFDTQFSYRRLLGAWERLDAATTWSGDNADFFWTVNFRGASPQTTTLYAVNGVAADNIKYIDQGGVAWTNFRPQLNSSGINRFLESAKIIIGFKDRLICLNTIEDSAGVDSNFVNRARWCQNGDPTDAVNGWIDDTPGRGGFIDATTKEAIISAQFIKDRLIVYFERSTYELVYTGNDTLPFIWQLINVELGAESRFSTVPFDQGVVAVGNVGVHTCNGVNVKRIDEKIPDEVFKIHNENDGPARVYGIRDYFKELVYWTFPDFTSDPTYPNRILVWNYQNNTWAFFEDTFTCFGYFQRDADLQWADLGNIYGTWEQWNDPWNSSVSQAQQPSIAAGNQEGFTFIIEPDRSYNEQALYITDMTAATSRLTIVDHNLDLNSYILIQDCTGITSLNGTIVQVAEIIDTNTVRIDTTFTGTYTGGGTIALVSNLDIRSKQWNPGTPIGQQFQMPYIDFLLDRTSDGEVSLDYYLNNSFGSSIQEQITNDVLLGTNTLFTKPETDVNFQDFQQMIWHRYYIMLQGQMIQIRIFMNDEQMRDVDISREDFVMNAIILYVKAQGRMVE